MNTVGPGHFRQRAREHFLRISTLCEQLQGPFVRDDAEAEARSIKAQLHADQKWANSSCRIHSLDMQERNALLSICSACAILNRFKVYAHPSRWVSRLSDAAAELAKYGSYPSVTTAEVRPFTFTP